MRIYFFILCSLLYYKSAAACTSFKDSYERADVKIRYDRGFVDVIDKNDNIINNKYLTKEMKIKLSSGVNLCISLTNTAEFRIEGINDPFQSYAIDSDKAVSIAGDNYIDKIAIESKSYITNIGNVIAQSAQFVTTSLWNFGGLGEKANFDCTPKIDIAEYNYEFGGFNNLGVVRFDEIEIKGGIIRQNGKLIANNLRHEGEDTIMIITDNIIQDDALTARASCVTNCATYTQINKLEGTDLIRKYGGSTAIIKNFMGVEISTNRDGSLSYNINRKEHLPNLTALTSRNSCGIPNFGKTCHYNAALQVLYAIDTIRDRILVYNGYNRFILAFKKLFQLLRSGTVQESDITEFLKELQGNTPYVDAFDPAANLSYWIRLLRKAGLNANIENIRTSQTDDERTSVDSNVLFVAEPYDGSKNMSQLVKQNELVINIGDYVIIYSGDDTDHSWARYQTIDEITLEDNRYQPIAAISENTWHCWATVKQLDGTFMQYNDEKVRKVSEFDNLTSTVLYKRIQN